LLKQYKALIQFSLGSLFALLSYFFFQDPILFIKTTKYTHSESIKKDVGYNYIIKLDEFNALEKFIFSIPDDRNETEMRSYTIVKVDGIELYTPHAMHSNIRTSGGGRYSLWGSYLYFSRGDTLTIQPQSVLITFFLAPKMPIYLILLGFFITSSIYFFWPTLKETFILIMDSF